MVAVTRCEAQVSMERAGEADTKAVIICQLVRVKKADGQEPNASVSLLLTAN